VVSFPEMMRTTSGLGEARFALGDRLVDRYLEFVAGRARPNTLRAVAFDLKTFFSVIFKEPVAVTPADVFEFLADQRGDRSVVRLADRDSGLSARTIARRLSSVSGLYAYLVARGDTPVQANTVAASAAATYLAAHATPRLMAAPTRHRRWSQWPRCTATPPHSGGPPPCSPPEPSSPPCCSAAARPQQRQAPAASQ
jgi:integrase/recombinase XerD